MMILDELDSGVGSRLGGAIGRLLRRMSSPQAISHSLQQQEFDPAQQQSSSMQHRFSSSEMKHPGNDQQQQIDVGSQHQQQQQSDIFNQQHLHQHLNGSQLSGDYSRMRQSQNGYQQQSIGYYQQQRHQQQHQGGHLLQSYSDSLQQQPQQQRQLATVAQILCVSHLPQVSLVVLLQLIHISPRCS